MSMPHICTNGRADGCVQCVPDNNTNTNTINNNNHYNNSIDNNNNNDNINKKNNDKPVTHVVSPVDVW